jgi:DNA-directed RNA polymerase subunit beta'
VLMLSTNNILSPAHGKPIAVPSQDMVIGVYYLTYHAEDDLSEAQPDHFGKNKLVAYSGYDEVQRAWEQRILDQREVPTKREAGIAEFTRRPILLRLPGGNRVVTTIGRGLFNMRVEEGLREVLGPEYQGDYTYINYTMTKKGLATFINKLVALYGANKVARILDVFKEVGFHFATRAAVTVSKNDVVVPAKEKAEILGTHEAMVEQLRQEYDNGFLSEEERRNKVQEIWREADVQITAATRANFNPLNPIYMMATSGARGDIKQIRQLAGWRGQMANPKGEIVEQPVKSSFIEGLSVLEFFISTHGARKGLADTALRTADSGYLTRRLVDVCQDVTVSEEDCGTKEWVPMSPWSRRREENPELDGATLAENVKRPRSDRVVLKKGEIIGPAQIGLLREIFSTLPNAKVKVKKGRAAAALIAMWTHEPNENLLGRHLGEKIVEEETGEVVFDRDTHIGLETRAQILDVLARSSETDPMVPVRSVLKCNADAGVCQKCYGYALANNVPAEIGDAVGHVAAQSIGEPGTQLTMRTFHTGGVAGSDITHGLPRVVELFEARKPKGVARIAEVSGRVSIEDTERGCKVTITPDEGASKEYVVAARRTHVMVEDGDLVDEGTQLTPGSLYPADVLKHAGDTATERYLVNEVQEVYRSQGVEINDKHIELIVRQMMKKVRIVIAGDTQFLPGQLVDRAVFVRENVRVKEDGGEVAEAEAIILGITKASLATESFLSAASFQETTKVLTDAAIEGKTDTLQGLKENVIIGKLIPAGTGLRQYRGVEIFPAGRGDALAEADRMMTSTDAASFFGEELED